MPTHSPKPASWRQRATLAAIVGMFSGATRAVVTWLLEHSF